MDVMQTLWGRMSAYFYLLRTRYERHLFVALLLAGSVTDALFLPQIDAQVTYLLLGSILTVVILETLLSAVITDRTLTSKWWQRIGFFLDFTIPFLLGSLLSAVFVYYSRSASVFTSAPFLILLFLVMVSVELARSHLRQLELRMGLIYFILYMGMAFAVPVFVGGMGPLIFVASGILALLVIVLVIALLAVYARKTLRLGLRVFVYIFVSITLFVNVLYFMHIIPPIPLALRVAEVYHGVSRTESGDYAVLVDAEQPHTITPFSSTVVRVADTPLAFFTSVFAPTALATSVVHDWQWKDMRTGEWKTKTRLTFPISGGRDSGYRGYSIVAVTPGYWRVRVETQRGEVLGVEYFTAVAATTPIVLEQQIR